MYSHNVMHDHSYLCVSLYETLDQKVRKDGEEEVQIPHRIAVSSSATFSLPSYRFGEQSLSTTIRRWLILFRFVCLADEEIVRAACSNAHLGSLPLTGSKLPCHFGSSHCLCRQQTPSFIDGCNSSLESVLLFGNRTASLPAHCLS